MIAKIAKIRWPDGYKPGDCFEESTNQEGKGAIDFGTFLQMQVRVRPRPQPQPQP